MFKQFILNTEKQEIFFLLFPPEVCLGLSSISIQKQGGSLKTSLLSEKQLSVLLFCRQLLSLSFSKLILWLISF